MAIAPLVILTPLVVFAHIVLTPIVFLLPTSSLLRSTPFFPTPPPSSLSLCLQEAAENPTTIFQDFVEMWGYFRHRFSGPYSSMYLMEKHLVQLGAVDEREEMVCGGDRGRGVRMGLKATEMVGP